MSRHAIDKRTQDLPDPGNDPGGAGLALIPFFTGTETELQFWKGRIQGLQIQIYDFPPPNFVVLGGYSPRQITNSSYKGQKMDGVLG